MVYLKLRQGSITLFTQGASGGVFRNILWPSHRPSYAGTDLEGRAMVGSSDKACEGLTWGCLCRLHPGGHRAALESLKEGTGGQGSGGEHREGRGTNSYPGYSRKGQPLQWVSTAGAQSKQRTARQLHLLFSLCFLWLVFPTRRCPSILGTAAATLSQAFPRRKPSLHYVLTILGTAWFGKEKEITDVEICTWKKTKWSTWDRGIPFHQDDYLS